MPQFSPCIFVFIPVGVPCIKWRSYFKIKKNKDNLRNGTLLITHVANFSENQPTQVQMSVRPSQTIVFNLHKSLKTLDSLVKATKTG